MQSLMHDMVLDALLKNDIKRVMSEISKQRTLIATSSMTSAAVVLACGSHKVNRLF
jgi:hypothetical protein